jgi:hypothetical protein
VDPLIRVLDVVFWIIAAAFVGALVFPMGQDVDAALMGMLVVWSGVMTWFPETEAGRLTRRRRFYASIFAISLFASLIYISALIF